MWAYLPNRDTASAPWIRKPVIEAAAPTQLVLL